MGMGIRASGAVRNLLCTSRSLSGRADRYNSGFFIKHKRKLTTRPILRYSSGHRKGRLKILSIKLPITPEDQYIFDENDHTQPFAKNRVVIDQQYPYGFRWWQIALQIKPSYISQSNDGKRPYRTLNHLRDGIWSHHGQQTALVEIELSLLEFAVSITRSVHAIEVSVVRDRISRSVS